MIKSIMVAVDGSKPSDKALEFACNLADKYGATLHIHHTVEVTLQEHAMFLGSAGFAFEASEEDIQKAGAKVVEAATKIADKHRCNSVLTKIDHGSPSQNILDYAKANDVDMIVMGSRGLSDLGGLLMGSVSHKVSHLAECSCVTVR